MVTFRYIIQGRGENLADKKKDALRLLSSLKRGFLPWLKNKEIKKAASPDRKQGAKKAVTPYRKWEVKKASARLVIAASHFSERYNEQVSTISY